jgi:hypothetical protein
MLAAKFAKAAAQAERLRVEALARRQAKRCVIAAIGAIFGIAALAMGHVAVELVFAPKIGALEITSALIVFDAVVAVALCAIAANSRPGKVEREAAHLRMRALGQMKEELSFVALVPALVGPRRIRQWYFVAEFVSRFLRRKSPVVELKRSGPTFR